MQLSHFLARWALGSLFAHSAENVQQFFSQVVKQKTWYNVKEA